jgi:hypothetical protein
MIDSLIIITCHKKDPITNYHINRFKEFHRDIPVIPIYEQDFNKLPYWDYDWMWAYCDNVFYRWFLSKQKILAKRYFLFDYDTFCNDHIKNFYEKVWDKRVACSNHFSYKEKPKWQWFIKYKDDLQIYIDNLYGIVPYSGLMIGHDEVELLIREQINNPIWRDKISELRIGTILNINNISISFIDIDKQNFISHHKYYLPKNFLGVKGIFHPLK